MKISKLLNSLSILVLLFVILFLNNELSSTEPVDIWKIENKPKEEIKEEIISENIEIDNSKIKIKINSESNKNLEILSEEKLTTDNILLVGLYDPEENGLNIDMWSNSDGEEIRTLILKINNAKLSSDAKQILEIALLTNSYFPETNMDIEEFLKFKSDYLIDNNDLKLIRKYLIKNKKTPINNYLITHYVDQYLSNSDLESACSIFNEVDFFDDDYLSKFQIYCLINQERREEAQLIYDLKKELGLDDNFFEKVFNFLMGYNISIEKEISEKNILDFHLSHRINDDFSFTPNNKTTRIIWKYLSSSNLLENLDTIDLENEEKIQIIEKATHEKNYKEEELFGLYKRFQFSLNQLLTVKDTYKVLPTYQGRALLYQRLLLTIDVEEKLDLSSKLKQSFLKDNIENAFYSELSKILKDIDPNRVPADFSTFYESNIISEKNRANKIKYNNKIIHQSKLINYFSNESSIQKIEKDTNDLLKKIKKDKKYQFTTKDIMMLDSFKSDGVKISNKYENLYVSDPNIPTDIQVKIKNNETGLVLLRIVEIIGEDNLTNLGSENLYFIISALNKLNMDKLRNKILLKVLPLKV